MRQTRRPAKVAVEVTTELQATWAEYLLGKVGGFAKARLFLQSQRSVVVFPGGEDFIAGLRRAGRENGGSPDGSSGKAIEHT